jgi:glycosyltransferase involved in cell wall biosynthesis
MAVATIVDPVAEASSTMFPIGIVIPTFNRVDVLMSCLSHLERQTTPEFEVVIVDDGSSDTTSERVSKFQEQTPLRLRYVRQPNSGPARARNLGISLLRSPICLFIGDDILASPDLVAMHLGLHLRRPELQVAGLGLTRWSETGQDVTKFMQWLDTGGVQFAYGDLLSGVQPDWKHFYTSNLSVKTELLRQHQFNEEFPDAATEDIELGYRIHSQHGLELVFMPDAVALHLHPTSFRAACKRMVKAGSTAQILYRLWPELEPAGPTGFRKLVYGILLRNRWLIRASIFISDGLTLVWCPNPLMRVTLMAHYYLGNSGSRL